MPITDWLHYADHDLDPICRSSSGSYRPVTDKSQKGRREGLSRAPRKRGCKASKRGLSEEQTAVLICRDRTGNTADFMLKKADKAHIGAVLKPLLAADVILCTDSEKALAAVAKEMGITHRPVNLAAGQRVVAGVYHVQNVNAYDLSLIHISEPTRPY